MIVSRRPMDHITLELCKLWREECGNNGNRILFDSVKPEIHLSGYTREGFVCCGDLDRVWEIIDRHRNLRQIQSIQPFIWNGGAARLAETPMNTIGGEETIFLREIELIADPNVKNLDGFSLYGHWPCGMAGLSRLNIFQAIEALMMAKKVLKERFPGKKVACFFHVDYHGHGSSEMRTYFIRNIKWENWKKERGLKIGFEEDEHMLDKLYSQISPVSNLEYFL